MSRLGAIARGEPAWLLGGAAMLFQAVDMLLVIAVDALFLRRLGPAYLPYAYVGINLGAVALAALVLSVRSATTFALAVAMTAALAAVVLASVPFLAGAGFAVFFTVFFVVRLHDKLCFSYFLTYVQGVFPVREGKRKISRILGASSATCILVGLSVRPLIARISMEAVFVGAAAMSAALVALLMWCARLWPARGSGPKHDAGSEPRPSKPEIRASPFAAAFALLRTHRLARRLAAFFFCTMFVRYLVEFQFARTVAELYPTEAGLAGFVGTFRAGLALAFTLGQIFLTSRLLVRLQPGGTMRASTACLTVCALVAVALPDALPVMALHALWVIGYQMAIRPAFGIMLAPLDAVTRDRVGVLTGLADAAGCVASGLFLIAAQKALPARVLCIGVAALCLAMLAIARGLNREYFAALEASVVSADAGTRVDSLAALNFMAPHRMRDHLARLLEDPDVAVRVASVERLVDLPPAAAAELAERVLGRERDSRVLGGLARTLPRVLGERARPMLVEVAGRVQDERALANVIEAVGQIGGATPEPAIHAYLEHPWRRVRAAAVLTSLRLERTRPMLRRALAQLAGMLEAEEAMTRSAGLAVLAELGRPAFGRAAGASLGDAAPDVRASAVRAVEKLRPAYLLPQLAAMAEHDAAPEVRQAAQRACRALEGGAGALVRHVRALPAAERARVAAFLRAARGPVRFRILEKLLALGTGAPDAELLELVRSADDDALLAAVDAGLSATPPTLVPVAAYRQQGGEPALGLRMLSALGRGLPESVRIALIEDGVTAVLRLERAAGLAAGDAPAVSAIAEARRARMDELLLAVAALEGPLEQPALVKALEGALGADRNLASMSLEVLEARLAPEVFARVGPLVESWADEGKRAALAREWLDRRVES